MEPHTPISNRRKYTITENPECILFVAIMSRGQRVRNFQVPTYMLSEEIGDLEVLLSDMHAEHSYDDSDGYPVMHVIGKRLGLADGGEADLCPYEVSPNCVTGNIRAVIMGSCTQ